MSIGVEISVLPQCPRPGHGHWRVWRDGFRGKDPARRQRFRCVNPDDSSDWHRFTLPVLRAAATAHRCLDCQQLVPTHAGPAVAEGYHYLSKVVAGALVDVAKGRTYSEASQAARQALAGASGDVASGVGFSVHGQLVADWVEVFSEVVLTQPTRWPQALLLDATEFWRRVGDGRRAPAFTLLFAYGYDAPEGPLPEPVDPWEVHPPERATNGRLLRIGLARTEDEDAWSAFLRGWYGTPLVAVTDGNGAVRNAVKSVWPGGAVTLVRCVYHWRKNLVERVVGDLARAAGVPGTSTVVQKDELLALAQQALGSPTDLRAFVQAAHRRFDGTKALCLDWLETNGGDALAQLEAADEMPGPQSIGPLEQVINRTRQRLAGRAQGLRNPVRTQRMLDLLAAGLRNDANADQWADLIYAHLADNHRRPAHRQREVAGLRM